MRLTRLLLPLLPLIPPTTPLNIACISDWIEHTPLFHTAQHLYAGPDVATLSRGGVVNLIDGTFPSVDLGANAETQGLKQYVQHRNIRLIGIIVEVPYRLVANTARANITALTDLRGKRIGTIPGTSAEVFIRQLLATVGLQAGTDYQIVSGNVCMREPCAADTLPEQLRAGQIDAFGIWETSVELGVRALGGLVENGGTGTAVTFQDLEVYRVYSLYSTMEKLADPQTRKRIVAFVKGLAQAYEVFKAEGEEVLGEVAQRVGVDGDVLKAVWGDHLWGPGDLGDRLLEFLNREDEYLAGVDKRQRLTKEELKTFVDASVYAEAAADLQ
ncbi:putative aliphatic sulfonates-binding protein [Dichotomopilus funicola]|uniref:Aliphatic sulfonates-binding protein n=1 Tax=Dichotomopilus funicola TaxID=1934379 RepID=A0AAN6ZIM5_9PEZI|nr:putative aliphatic sulfonates-binding protein [Dichotomopilus funicola]